MNGAGMKTQCVISVFEVSGLVKCAKTKAQLKKDN